VDAFRMTETGIEIMRSVKVMLDIALRDERFDDKPLRTHGLRHALDQGCFKWNYKQIRMVAGAGLEPAAVRVSAMTISHLAFDG
jgi:hypothetical protein